MPFLNFDVIKDFVTMHQVLALIGWEAFRKEPTALRGPCPLHGSSSKRSRSFAANETGFMCHSCKKKGDVIRFWAEFKGLTMYTAAFDLCRLFKLEGKASRGEQAIYD